MLIFQQDWYDFRAGGLVIGTHAFLGYGNMLGARWDDSDRTQDVDFAHAGKKISLLLPGNVEVKTSEAIESLEMGFLPVSGLGGKTGGRNLIPQEPEFRLDFLTPLHRNATAPYVHPQLNVTLQPLPHMEYSLEQVEQTVLMSTDGAVLLNVPSPVRYALRKLLVHGIRAQAFRAKAAKDLAQAACLLEFLGVHRPEASRAALDDMLSRGKGWVTQLRKGARALAATYPALPVAATLRRATTR